MPSSDDLGYSGRGRNLPQTGAALAGVQATTALVVAWTLSRNEQRSSPSGGPCPCPMQALLQRPNLVLPVLIIAYN